MAKVILARIKPRTDRHRWAQGLFWDKRTWWPLYIPVHTDPSLGAIGAIRHHHVAWNRIGKTMRDRIGRPSSYVFFAEDVIETRPCNLPIISSPIAPHPPKSTIHAMIAAWKKQQTQRAPA